MQQVTILLRAKVTLIINNLYIFDGNSYSKIELTEQKIFDLSFY